MNPVLQDLEKRMKASEGDTEIQSLEVHERKHLKVTVAEVKALCDNAPNHPLAASKRKSVKGLPDDRQVILEQTDIEAMMTGQDIELYKEINTTAGETLIKKRLIPGKKSTPSAVAPSQPPSK